jgi:lipopolysaccharide/colanic/teichoic acid biosynthesis glycosyltransferase
LIQLKRIVDIVFSLSALIFMFPALIIIGSLLKLYGGPAIFRQERVGRGGTPFRIFKFRSMVVGAEKQGASVTAENDPRITPLGRWLRKTKIDELPELFNVLRGDMSIVGPRPEVAPYVALWPEDDRNTILSVRPGISDYATLYYHDEQAVLGVSDDPEKSYVEQILPHKVRLYNKYLRERNLGLDLRIILGTLARMAGF